MIPSTVVSDISGHEFLDGGIFGGGVPEGEMADEPLAVGPDMVVLGVEGEDAVEESRFGRKRCGEVRHHLLAVVPRIEVSLRGMYEGDVWNGWHCVDEGRK